jgi:hypothetical protein
MKIRFARFFRFAKIKTQDDDETRVALELPAKHMLCKLTPQEAIMLYNQLDEEYTRQHSKGEITICLPSIEEFTEVTNLEMLMGYDRGAGVTETASQPVEILKQLGEGLIFADMKGFEFFVEKIQEYIDKKVKEEVAKAKGDLL